MSAIRHLRHFWLLLAVGFFALAFNWLAVDEWGHATGSVTLGAVCYAAAELVNWGDL